MLVPRLLWHDPITASSAASSRIADLMGRASEVPTAMQQGYRNDSQWAFPPRRRAAQITAREDQKRLLKARPGRTPGLASTPKEV
jgi:hypothetical protein